MSSSARTPVRIPRMKVAMLSAAAPMNIATMKSSCPDVSGAVAELGQQQDARRPAKQHDHHQDEQHGEDHEGHAAVRPGDLAGIVGGETRVPRAEAGR